MMKTDKLSNLLATAFGVLCLMIASLTPQTALAQSNGAQGEDGPTRITVLNVPGGGTDKLIDALSQLDNVELKQQGWFLEQIKSRGFQAKGIMKRSEDIKWLMDGANIDYILYLTPEGDTGYTARVVGPQKGTEVHHFPVDRTPDGLSQAGAKMVQQEFGKYLYKQRHPVDPEAERRKREQEKARIARLEQEQDPNEVKKKAAAQKNAAQALYSKDWLLVSVRGAALRRDLHVAGANEAVLAYTSVFYPGLALSVEAFPMGMTNVQYASVGFYADYTQGFDSVPVVDNDGNEASVSISHLELEGGVMYELGDPIKLRTTDQAHVALTIGVRHASYSVAENPALPSVSNTSLVLGARATRKAFSDAFKVRAGVEIEPIGVYGTGATLFGESSHTYGFGASLGGMFAATDSLGVTLDYEFQLQRTLFTGTGEADFEDANAFELVQGLTGGLFYRY